MSHTAGLRGRSRVFLAAFAAGLVVAAAGCASGGGSRKPDKVTTELLSTPKEALFEKGKALINKKKYELGRKYLTFVFETYPNDPLGREALLMVADAFFRQGGTTGYTEARFRYRDYLNRYPGAPKRDYARYQFARLLRQGAREARPRPDHHARGDRAVPAPAEGVPQFGVHGRSERAESAASPTSSPSTSSAWGTSTCARGRRRRR